MANLDHQNDPGNRRIKQNAALTATISYDQFPSTTSGQDSVVPFAVPRNSIVTSVIAVVSTAFSGTTPEVIVGTSSDDDGFVTAANFTPTVGSKVGSGALLNATTGSNDLPILVEMTWGASKPAAGELTLIVQYVTYGKYAGDPSQAQVAAAEV